MPAKFHMIEANRAMREAAKLHRAKQIAAEAVRQREARARADAAEWEAAVAAKGGDELAAASALLGIDLRPSA